MIYEKIYTLDSGKTHQRSPECKGPEGAARYGALEGWASIVINLLLFVVKIVLGISLRSRLCYCFC